MKKLLAMLVVFAVVLSMGAIAFAWNPGLVDAETEEKVLVTDWQGNGWLDDSSYPAGWVNDDGDLEVGGGFGWQAMDNWCDMPRDASDEFELLNSIYPKMVSRNYEYLVYVVKVTDDFWDFADGPNDFFRSIEIDHLWYGGTDCKMSLNALLDDAGIDVTNPTFPEKEGYWNLVMNKGELRHDGLSIMRWWGEGALLLKEVYLTNDPPEIFSDYEEIEWDFPTEIIDPPPPPPPVDPTQTTVPVVEDPPTGDVGMASVMVLAALAAGTVLFVSKKRK